MTITKRLRPHITALALLCAYVPAQAQTSVTITPNEDYEAGALHRALLGNGWRSLWTTPINVPVFDIGTFQGGLKVTRKGGGNQTRTLRFETSDGREYLFRSVDKYPVGQAMPEPVRDSWLGDIIQDQVATLFPAGALMVPALLEVNNVLQVRPRLYVMPDDPRLGEFRREFAGMLGTVELSPQENDNDEPGFAGSRKIKSADKFLEDVEASKMHRMDERELFAIRLIDFLVNDNDRTADNMRFARYGTEGAYTWRPLPRDRDRAFSNADGALIKWVIHPVYPKLVKFGTRYDLEGLVFESYGIDRRLLQRITRADAEQIALSLQSKITDAVIEKEIQALPREWKSKSLEMSKLRSTLRARRDRLREVALDFYDWLASEVDVHGTDETDRAIVDRHSDGRVTVTIRGRDESASATPYYTRTFLPEETNEVRVFLHGGNDVAVVRGADANDITIRVIGGGDDDLLTDSTSGTGTRFYDEKGKNRFVTKGGTKIDEKNWKPPREGGGVRFDAPWRPDWGAKTGFGPAFDYVEGGGLVLGYGPRYLSHGFRRLPHKLSAGANLLIGTGNRLPGVNAYADYRFENSPKILTLKAKATRYESFRFYGYGNNSPELSRKAALVNQDVIAIEPALAHQIGFRSREDLDVGYGKKSEDDKDSAKAEKKKPGLLRPLIGKIEAGPLFLYNKADDPETFAPGIFESDVARAGGRIALELDKTAPVPSTAGFTLKAEGSAFPAILDIDETALLGEAVAAAYAPLLSNGLHLAVRAGGMAGSGDVPVQDFPYVGGRSTVRGFSSHRFIGDRAAFGSAEIRLPLDAKVPLIINWKPGVFALFDIGRVWLDGESPGGWHKGIGGGVWLNALGQTFSASFAHSDEGNRFYLQKGLSF